jgi:hypothetical protein
MSEDEREGHSYSTDTSVADEGFSRMSQLSARRHHHAESDVDPGW